MFSNVPLFPCFVSLEMSCIAEESEKKKHLVFHFSVLILPSILLSRLKKRKKNEKDANTSVLELRKGFSSHGQALSGLLSPPYLKFSYE